MYFAVSSLEQSECSYQSCTQAACEESMKKIIVIALIIYEFMASWLSSVGTNLSGSSGFC